MAAQDREVARRETDGEIVLKADLPGFQQQEIAVQVTGDTIEVRARHQEETPAEPGDGGLLSGLLAHTGCPYRLPIQASQNGPQ